ncbi:concanavalin A-like lectin/glucanase domain-containing protein [Pterulicium gracile]|uniref:Concanavalin A-like lectin/glucanase domain-containing protein n=1 Tax=Pterulicium gracile TaxID=1884261 RepID=A0A5C3Q7P1_9AGAR|nr:concanavalin A-like lectin/glucanase domain-containing protein [Pterula gracilis]
MSNPEPATLPHDPFRDGKKFTLDGADASDSSAISAGDLPPSAASMSAATSAAARYPGTDRPSTGTSTSTSVSQSQGTPSYNFSRPRPPFSSHSRTGSANDTTTHGVPGSSNLTPPHTPHSPGFNLGANGYYGSGATSHSSLPRVGSSHSGINPFATPNASRPALRIRESFASPPIRPMTIYGQVGSGATTPGAVPPTPGLAALPAQVTGKSLLEKSTMLDPNQPLSKPWLEKSSKDPLARIAYCLTYFVILLGVAGGAVRCYLDYINVPMLEEQGNLCVVVDEDFSRGDEGGRLFGDNGLFFREVDMSGFGNGEFEMTTDSNNNSFVRDGHLYILPTLSSAALGEGAVLGDQPTVFNITNCSYNITHGASYTTSSDLELDDLDSSDSSPSNSNSNSTTDRETQRGTDVEFDQAAYLRACSAVSNSTIARVINPVQSARLSTRRSASIRYGKVEVRAKVPRGDWMWPAIWMLPRDQKYGGWPLSGEIDIMETRGNGPEYPHQGSNVVSGAIHWGPLVYLNSAWRTNGFWKKRRESYGERFHTYTLEWTEDWMRMYVDTRLHKMFNTKFGGNSGADGFWNRGDYPQVVYDNTGGQVVLQNPWVNGTKSAPFDESFYLILNVAVGSTNGWFPDGAGGKPWLDGSASAMSDFIKNKDKWLPTWPEAEEDRAMVIDSVKMWQLC